MSVEIIRKYYANIKFWFKSWSKDKDQSLLDHIISNIKSVMEMIGSLDISAIDINDRILVSEVIRETQEIAIAIETK